MLDMCVLDVFSYENLGYPRRISKHNYTRESTVDLLLISDDTKQQLLLDQRYE